MVKNLLEIFFVTLFVSIDIFSKNIAMSAGIVILNDGISFGLFRGFNQIIIGISMGALIFYYMLVSRNNDKIMLFNVGILLMIAGTIGNLIDRLTIGKVIDFVSIGNFPVFNFADSFLFLGLAFIILDYLISMVEDYKLKRLKIKIN